MDEAETYKKARALIEALRDNVIVFDDCDPALRSNEDGAHNSRD